MNELPSYHHTPQTRRDFLRRAGAAVGGLALAASSVAGAAQTGGNKTIWVCTLLKRTHPVVV
jgi:hypothetical protein